MREECDVREICLSALRLEIRGFKDGGGLNTPREKKERKNKNNTQWDKLERNLRDA